MNDGLFRCMRIPDSQYPMFPWWDWPNEGICPDCQHTISVHLMVHGCLGCKHNWEKSTHVTPEIPV